jgi:hypothetical protein
MGSHIPPLLGVHIRLCSHLPIDKCVADPPDGASTRFDPGREAMAPAPATVMLIPPAASPPSPARGDARGMNWDPMAASPLPLLADTVLSAPCSFNMAAVLSRSSIRPRTPPGSTVAGGPLPPDVLVCPLLTRGFRSPAGGGGGCCRAAALALKPALGS